MGKITTVIFDMYETLVHNDRGLWRKTFGEICRVQGLAVDPAVLYGEWKALEVIFRGERVNLEEPDKSPPFMPYAEVWRDCFVRSFSNLGLEGDTAAAARDAVRDLGRRQPYHDATEALPAIQAGWRTAVLSNADDGFLYPVIDENEWTFEAVLSSEAARAYKPLPLPFLKIMGMLGVRPEQSVYVGDTLYDDILGGQRVGMKTAWINRDGASRKPGDQAPDYEIRSLAELPQLLAAVP